MKHNPVKIVEPKEPFPLELRDLDAGFTALIVTAGNSLRVTIPVGTVRMCQLMAGDQVQMKIIRAGREQRPTYKDLEKKQEAQNLKDTKKLLKG